MIKVGFTIIGGKTKWMGGINYLKNLLFAISQSDKKNIQPVLFVGTKTDEKLLKEFEGLAEIKRYPVFDRFSFQWFIDVIARDILKRNFIINKIVKENDIKAFSHSYIYGADLKCLSINWIPDFQHVRLPHMFTKLNFFVRNYRLKSLIKYSDLVVLSSYDALNDYKKFMPAYVNKTKVIHFVSQTTSFEKKPVEYLYEKYQINSRFFFLPNQFWAHKNHQVALDAIKLAKEKEGDILLICSGHMVDERNADYINGLENFVNDNSLQKNIRFLGLIPFNDVLLFMQYAIAIVNPSYFEGWSSTVEEAKSMHQKMILSNIPVHLEQAPADGQFFNPDSKEELADILVKNWIDNKNNAPDTPGDYTDELRKRTLDFANEYLEIFSDLKNKN